MLGPAELIPQHLEKLVVVLARPLHLLVDYLTHVLKIKSENIVIISHSILVLCGVSYGRCGEQPL